MVKKDLKLDSELETMDIKASSGITATCA